MTKKSNPFNPEEELDRLFKTTPPAQLKKSLSEIFTRCLVAMDKDIDHDTLYKLVTDFYLVFKFLEKAEQSGKFKK